MSEIDDLKKLDELKNQGVITEEEFQTLKTSTLKKAQSTEERLQSGVDSISETDWAMYLHLSQFLGYLIPFAGLIAPIIMWQMRKDTSAIIDEHGKNVANWTISLLIYYTISGILCLLIIGLIGLLILVPLVVIFPILGAVKAKNGEVWKYPMTITFIK